MKIILGVTVSVVVFVIVFFLYLNTRAYAWGEEHCWWDGRDMRCRHGWTWQERREWREDEWRERMRRHEHEHDHDEWNYRR